MSDEQRAQIEAIVTEIRKLPDQAKEGALLYLQGMSAAANLIADVQFVKMIQQLTEQEKTMLLAAMQALIDSRGQQAGSKRNE